jgi:hypothetical protein
MLGLIFPDGAREKTVYKQILAFWITYLGDYLTFFLDQSPDINGCLDSKAVSPKRLTTQ